MSIINLRKGSVLKVFTLVFGLNFNKGDINTSSLPLISQDAFIFISHVDYNLR